MKKQLFIFFLVSYIRIWAGSDVIHTFEFNEPDFSIVKSTTDSVMIVSNAMPAFYSNPTDPNIPYVGRTVAFDSSDKLEIDEVICYKRLIDSAVKLSSGIKPVPTTKILDSEHNNMQYEKGVYPKSNCVLSSCHNYGDVCVANFAVTPFIYDSEKQELYFVDSITVKLKQIVCDTESFALNSYEIVNELEGNITIARIDGQTMLSDSEDTDMYEYLIVTSEQLKESFQPLADWKRKKGITSKIITLEEIEQQYTGNTSQIKIKSCIKDMYENHFTQFVLLGGDICVVPTQMCYVDADLKYYLEDDEIENEKNIPADVYYSCLTNLDWDTDGNGKVGEFGEFRKDKIDITPIVYVTRASVRTVDEAEVFVNRIIGYEQSPKFVNNIFQTGTILTYHPLNPEENSIYGEKFADKFYNEVINRKVFIGCNKLFDTYSYSGEVFSSATVMNELNSGYQFAQIFSHGSRTALSNYNGNIYFNITNATNLNNTGNTLVTTMACSTNAFDKYETKWTSNPCLSEALMRNPNSGIIGYLGSSRLGWYNGVTHALDFSMAYETYFYERLFSEGIYKPDIKHYGALIAMVKASCLAYADNNITYRWLHYSINGLGDPETPIYNKTPRVFYGATAEYDSDGILNVKTGYEDARICVSSKNSDKYYKVSNGSEDSFDTGYGTFDVWITKQNYVPKHFEVIKPRPFYGDLQLASQILKVTPNPTSNIVNVTYYTDKENPELAISLTNINTGSNYMFYIDESENPAKLSLYFIPNGVYIVSLVENGVLIANGKQLIKQ